MSNGHDDDLLDGLDEPLGIDPFPHAELPLPVPEAEVDDAQAALDDLETALDDLIIARSAARDVQLEAWEGPARDTWDDEFVYSQADIQLHIDDVQALRSSIDRVVEAIEAHNEDLRRRQPLGGF